MRIQISAVAVIIYSFLYANHGLGQGTKTVLWQFEANPSVNGEVVLKFTACVANGWHLYSQHLAENGPMPTRFSFDAGGDYVLPMNAMEEKGVATVFHDDVYGMEITWYTGTVFFAQRVRLTPQTTHVRGTIEFMTCNDHTCIPGKQDFDINVRPGEKASSR
jgi:hypothetical protein